LSKDPQIDAYIARAKPFAQPILNKVRASVHANCPDVKETLKWSSPAFVYKGKIICNMAAFKEHAMFGFWHGELVTGGAGLGAMGSFGRLTSIDDLPDDGMLAPMFARALKLIDDGVKPPHVVGRGKHPKPAIGMAPAFQSALEASTSAKTVFDGFPPSQQREYLDWIVNAKREETREKRIAQAVEWLAEGKRRNWKYENC
jgi:uncharacterized protein YdeI (YjbR/CyaY-like superfamily)